MTRRTDLRLEQIHLEVSPRFTTSALAFLLMAPAAVYAAALWVVP